MQLIIPAGVNILDFLQSKGVYISAPCSGAGLCGKCKVRLLAGQLDITPADREHLSEGELEQGFRLACKAFTRSPVRIEFTESGGSFLTPDRLDLSLDKSHAFALACDIGSTTIAMSLTDLDDKRPVRTVTAANTAARFGADVVSRIASAVSGKGGQIRQAMQQDLTALLDELGLGGLNVTKMTIAGNTAMYHMLLGLDCGGLAAAPFEPLTLGGQTLPLCEVLGAGASDMPVTLIKGISAFVGGDIASGLLAAEPFDGCTLFLDLGTNGEAALITDDRLLCASAAAGPALEGGQLSCGMGGVSGAVCRVYDRGVGIGIDTVDNAPPIGLCGSGAIDALYWCLRHGLVDSKGTFLDSLIDSGFELAPGITLTQQDVREIQLAKAAIRACLDTLVSTAGVRYEDISSLCIAGGFGHYLDIASACGIGLIPKSLAGKARIVGNTSLKGAQRSLYEPQLFERAGQLAQKAETLSLHESEDFKRRFIECISMEE